MNGAATGTGLWGTWLKAEAASWLFVLRTVVAMLLALLVAFRLDLSSPGSAAVTVSIIALPQAGMVLEKSFYRLLGTLLGAVVTLFLITVFVQQRDSFILAVALWIGGCTAASSWFRGFQAYGWLLCGYTTCLIGFPAFMDANHAFDIAVDRVTIVSVGILSAGVVNATILPLRSTETLIQLVRRCFIDFVAFAELATRVGNADGLSVEHHRFSRDLAQLEATRSSSIFEDPTARVRSHRLLGFIGAFMVSSSRLHLLHRQLNLLDSHQEDGVLLMVDSQLRAFRSALRIGNHVPATAMEAIAVATKLSDLRQGIAMPLADETTSPPRAESKLAWQGTVLLINEAIQEAHGLAELYADMGSLRSTRIQKAPVKLRIGSDVLQAILSGLRAALVVGVSSAFWIASAWPAGFSMTLIGVVGCALFSSAAHPTTAALNMCKGFVIAIPALIFCFCVLLPAANDFYMLALVLSPFMAFGAWLMTRPGKILIGGGFLLCFLTALNVSSVMQYDFMAVFNNAIGYILGIVMAAVSLAVIGPGHRSWRAIRARKVLLQSLRVVISEGTVGLRARFESQVRDLTLSLVDVRAPAIKAGADEFLGLLILEMGDALIRLRINPTNCREAAADVALLLQPIVKAVERQDAAALKALDRPLMELLSALNTDHSDQAVADQAGAAANIQRFVALTSLQVSLAELAAFWSLKGEPSATHSS